MPAAPVEQSQQRNGFRSTVQQSAHRGLRAVREKRRKDKVGEQSSVILALPGMLGD